MSADTVRSIALNDDFGAMLATGSDRPGPPFWDRTLNFLHGQYQKTNSEIGALTQKKDKIEDQIEAKEDELATVQALLIEEFRQRRPTNPETGELIDPPFFTGEA